MKNIAKVLTLVLALTLCLSINVYAYTDEEVISTVENEKIMEGTNNGFEPNKTLTRAEITTIVIRMKDMETDAITACDFSDVDKDYWAYKYISIATKEGITNGVGENLFAPNREVTVAETVTMLVRAIADTSEVEKSGKWPDNYMNFAKKNKLLDGINKGKNDIIERIDTARIITNIINSPNWSKDEEDVNVDPIYEDEDGAIKKSVAASGVIVSLATMADHNNEVELAVPGKVVLLQTPDDELVQGICLPGTYVTFWLSGNRMWDIEADQKVTGVTIYERLAKVVDFGDGYVKLIRKTKGTTNPGDENVNASSIEYIDANTIVFLACDEMTAEDLQETNEAGEATYLRSFDELRMGSEFDIELCDDYKDNLTYNELSGTEVFYQSYINKKGEEVIVSMVYVKD